MDFEPWRLPSLTWSTFKMVCPQPQGLPFKGTENPGKSIDLTINIGRPRLDIVAISRPWEQQWMGKGKFLFSNYFQKFQFFPISSK